MALLSTRAVRRLVRTSASPSRPTRSAIGAQLVGRPQRLLAAAAADVDARARARAGLRPRLSALITDVVMPGRVPVHAHHAAEGLEPERIAEPGEQAVAAVVEEHGFGDGGAERFHPAGQPGRDAPAVQREIGDAGALHRDILADAARLGRTIGPSTHAATRRDVLGLPRRPPGSDWRAAARRAPRRSAGAAVHRRAGRRAARDRGRPLLLVPARALHDGQSGRRDRAPCRRSAGRRHADRGLLDGRVRDDAGRVAADPRRADRASADRDRSGSATTCRSTGCRTSMPRPTAAPSPTGPAGPARCRPGGPAGCRPKRSGSTPAAPGRPPRRRSAIASIAPTPTSTAPR